jgi:hypothetical protein
MRRRQIVWDEKLLDALSRVTACDKTELKLLVARLAEELNIELSFKTAG